MKKLATLALIAAALLTAHLVAAAVRSDRPLGVAEHDWISISERFGFVLDQKSPAAAVGADLGQLLIVPPDALVPELMPPVKGYFVVKTDAGWRRLTAVNPVEMSNL
jgi:hypothetical protein